MKKKFSILGLIICLVLTSFTLPDAVQTRTTMMTKVHMKTNMKMRILKEKRHHIFHMMMPSII